MMSKLDEALDRLQTTLESIRDTNRLLYDVQTARLRMDYPEANLPPYNDEVNNNHDENS